MAARSKRYVKAKVGGEEHVFEFNIEKLDDKELVARALGKNPGSVTNVSYSTSMPAWYRNAQKKESRDVDYKVH